MTLALAFERPDLLWALALAAPLVVLHLYRRRRRRLDVAFAPLLAEVAGPAAPLAFWRRLRDLASLLARLLALACLALAAAGPREASASAASRDLVVVLDADVTTLALESATETRFARQVALAKAHLHAADVGRVAVVSAGAIPLAFVPPTTDRAAAAAALDGLRPGFEPADLASAIAVARAAAASLANARVLVISSRAVPGEGDDPALEVVGAGTTDDDVGIVDQKVVPHEDGVRWTVSVTIQNFAATPRARTVALSKGRYVLLGRGRVRHDERRVDLPPRGTAEAVFEVLPAEGGTFVDVWLDEQDAFGVDDLASALLPSFPRPSVLVVHGGRPRPFVAAVLAAMGDSIDREKSGWVPLSDFASAPPRDVTVFDGVPPPSGPWRAGATVVLAPFGDPKAWGDGAPLRPGRAVSEPLVWRAEEGHPLLRGVDLSTAYVAKGTTIDAPGAAGLAFVEGDPVVAEGESGKARWIAFGLDPEGSDLPLRAALPVLLRNAIRRLATAPKAPFRPSYRAGEQIRPRLPLPGAGPFDLAMEARGSHASVLHAAAPRLEPDAEAPEAPYGPARWVTVRQGSETVASTATVDLDSGRDIAPVRAAAAHPAPAAGVGETGSRPWGPWLLLTAALLLLADLLLVVAGERKIARTATAA